MFAVDALLTDAGTSLASSDGYMLTDPTKQLLNYLNKTAKT